MSSSMPGATASTGCHDQIPSRASNASCSRAWRTSSRKKSRLPPVVSRRRWRDRESSGPPSTWCKSAPTRSSSSGATSTRVAWSSVQSRVTASGTGTPVRTVASTRVPDCAASSTRPAEASSSRWASSIARTTRSRLLLPARARSARDNAVNGAPGSRSQASTPANAPNGTAARDSVAAIRTTRRSSVGMRASASASSRDFPIPLGPASSAPDDPSATRASSASRPTNGHARSPAPGFM